MTTTRRRPTLEDADIQHAISSLRAACETNGWSLYKIEPRLFRIVNADHTPFYTVVIVRRPKGVYYDIGETLIAKASTVITKIIERTPRDV